MECRPRLPAFLASALAAALVAGGGAPEALGDGPKSPPPAPQGPSPAPAPAAPDSPAGRLLAKAREWAAKDPTAALPMYFDALRAADDYATKYVVRDEVLALPEVPARPVTFPEQATVTARIAEERERDVARKADGFEGRGWSHASRLLHQRLRGLEGLDDRQQDAHRDAIERIEHRLCDEATDAERAEARAIEGDLMKPDDAMAQARKAAGEGRGRMALRVMRAVASSSLSTQAQRDAAAKEADALRARMCEETPDEERRAADEVWEDPHWKGLGTGASHRFVYIGPKAFVETIAWADRIRMDLACEFLGDLVGRDLVADGQRLTIYYKERFDFGGGLGGGKRIDIGNKVIVKPIAGPLHYHELSHCTFDVGIVYPGFVEGIANFGAVFALDALGRPAEADGAIKSNRDSFQADYLDRRMRYFRIQPYQPSCGFLLTPITVKDPVARQAEWAKYRLFFRALRANAIDEPRDAERIRRFAYHWGEAFGWNLVDEAAKDRFPVGPEVKEWVPEEEREWSEKTAQGESYAAQGYGGPAIEPLEMVVAAHPRSECADRAKYALAQVRASMDDAKARDALYADLGVVSTWKICGPFYSRHGDPLLAVHEPERVIDLAAEYPNPVQVARWKDAKNGPDGRIDLKGQGIEYCDHAACYVLAWLESPKDAPDAVVFTGFDDTCALWVDGELVEKWSRPHGWVFDHHVAAVPLKAGKHRFLFKVVNGVGDWAFSARVVHADRTPIEGLKVLPPPAKDVPEALPEAKGHAVFLEEFLNDKTLPKNRFRTTAGSWGIEQKCLRRLAGGNVLWHKFEVAPYTSHDPPSALLWLQDRDLPSLTSFVVELLVRRPDEGIPHLAVTLHGEEKDDGLSGHTFVLRPGGEGAEVHLDEYERAVYWGTGEIAKAPEHLLRFVRRGRTLSCVVDGRPLLHEVDLPPLPHTGIGIMLWDRETSIARIRVERVVK